MAVVDTQMPHWGVRQTRDGRDIVGAELMGRMIREAGQNCHWIERKKETDEMSYKTESVRTEKSARLKK